MTELKTEFTGKLYLEVKGERVIGPGRVELLERIQDSGSIRQAALQMKMSYRQAWQFIDHMNTHLGEPVVVSARGGKGGGKAEVTPKGLAVVALFKTFHAEFQQFLEKKNSQTEF